MDHVEQISHQLNIKPFQTGAVIELLDDGNTIPFIARYRKEKTGSLDEEQIRQIHELAERLRALDKRRATVLASIEAQGLLDDALHAKIKAAATSTELEDLYLPYRPKRRTRALMAKEKGLDPLARQILAQPKERQSAEQAAVPFLNDDVLTVEEALGGARDIVAETISDDAAVRQVLRDKALEWATLQSAVVDEEKDERNVYALYYAFENRLQRIHPHQLLAINRGEAEKVLRVRVVIPERDWVLAVRTRYRPDRRSPFAEQLQLAMDDAAQRLLLPAIERDVRRTLTERAEAHAIMVFANNLRALLSQPPFTGQTILALDPAYRTGCKIAVVDSTGKVLETATVYPHKPQQRREAALKTLASLLQKHAVTLIAIGNGTASRETEQLVAELTRTLDGVSYLIVNEAGASVYSASKLARTELPELDVSLRGAVSIARRVQDPLAELVKIDPKSIGIGLYQHDVNQKALTESLNGVVESVVNRVGVDVNTASPALLAHVSGIGPKLAERIVAYRDENGRFTNRPSLKNVSGMGEKAFEQSAGFLRIRSGDNPLDASAIHPESYGIAAALLKRANLSPTAPLAAREGPLGQLKNGVSLRALADELGTGVPTLSDIFEQLVRPGRDPREDAPPPVLRSDVLNMDDLREGMPLSGTVRNVVDFGAFVDIGVKQDGLLHKSQIPRGVRLSLGDVIDVTIRSVDVERKRIGLGWGAN